MDSPVAEKADSELSTPWEIMQGHRDPPRQKMMTYRKPMSTAKKICTRFSAIRPYTPRHNGKVERSHREDQKRFYSCRSFYSLADFEKQLAVHNRRSNNFPMRPLGWLSPSEFSVQYV